MGMKCWENEVEVGVVGAKGEQVSSWQPGLFLEGALLGRLMALGPPGQQDELASLRKQATVRALFVEPITF